MESVASGIAVGGNQADVDYDAFLFRLQARFMSNIAEGKLPLFTTDADSDGALWTAYLAQLQESERQFHNCSCCRDFIRRFGALATIRDDGLIESAIWCEADAPEAIRHAVDAMRQAVRTAKITGVFMSSDTEWGHRETGVWHHMAVTPPASIVFKRTVLTAGQKMAERREDFKTVQHALNEFTQPMLEQALTLLRTDALYRSEKVLGQAEWLYNLHMARASAQSGRRGNVVWRAIATAPAGFCHPRSSMIGTLLDDIAAGMEFSQASERFKSKMHPLRYQRPQALPSAGNIAAAEKIVAELGAAGALARRFARLEEIQTIWKPAADRVAPAAGGVFGHLKSKSEAPATSMVASGVSITWEKFQRTVLPTARKMELLVPPGTGNYAGYLTAENADAPPILQWDRLEQRNPVSWYLYSGGSVASQWGLEHGWTPVTALSLQPSSWFDSKISHQGDGVLFVLEGARDSRTESACLFPEILKSEFHGIRSTIEAYSREAQRGGYEEASACGWILQKNGARKTNVRVTTDLNTQVEYAIDRWD